MNANKYQFDNPSKLYTRVSEPNCDYTSGFH